MANNKCISDTSFKNDYCVYGLPSGTKFEGSLQTIFNRYLPTNLRKIGVYFHQSLNAWTSLQDKTFSLGNIESTILSYKTYVIVSLWGTLYLLSTINNLVNLYICK